MKTMTFHLRVRHRLQHESDAEEDDVLDSVQQTANTDALQGRATALAVIGSRFAGNDKDTSFPSSHCFVPAKARNLDMLVPDPDAL